MNSISADELYDSMLRSTMRKFGFRRTGALQYYHFRIGCIYFEIDTSGTIHICRIIDGRAVNLTEVSDRTLLPKVCAPDFTKDLERYLGFLVGSPHYQFRSNT